MYMFNALAAATTNEVPSIAINSRPSGRGPGATSAPQSIVTITKPATPGLPSSTNADHERPLACSELLRSPLIPGTLDCIFQHLRPLVMALSGVLKDVLAAAKARASYHCMPNPAISSGNPRVYWTFSGSRGGPGTSAVA